VAEVEVACILVTQRGLEDVEVRVLLSTAVTIVFGTSVPSIELTPAVAVISIGVSPKITNGLQEASPEQEAVVVGTEPRVFHPVHIGT
jgi:hypothetical protein